MPGVDTLKRDVTVDYRNSLGLARERVTMTNGSGMRVRGAALSVSATRRNKRTDGDVPAGRVSMKAWAWLVVPALLLAGCQKKAELPTKRATIQEEMKEEVDKRAAEDCADGNNHN